MIIVVKQKMFKFDVITIQHFKAIYTLNAQVALPNVVVTSHYGYSLLEMWLVRIKMCFKYKIHAKFLNLVEN